MKRSTRNRLLRLTKDTVASLNEAVLARAAGAAAIGITLVVDHCRTVQKNCPPTEVGICKLE